MADGNYSVEQLYALAVQAGWPKEVAPWAAATAWVESSGDPRAASGTGPVGLWQINRGNAQHLGYSLEDRLDPLKNAQMALQLWNNRGGANVPPETAFADWWPYDRNSAAKDQKFQEALTQAKLSAGLPGVLDEFSNPLQGITDAATAPFQAIGKLADQFANFAKMMAWFVNPANDIRVLLGIFGIGFLFLGVLMLGREVKRG